MLCEQRFTISFVAFSFRARFRDTLFPFVPVVCRNHEMRDTSREKVGFASKPACDFDKFRMKRIVRIQSLLLHYVYELSTLGRNHLERFLHPQIFLERLFRKHRK